MKVITERIQEIDSECVTEKYRDSIFTKEFIWEYLDYHKKTCFDKACKIENVLDKVLKKL